MSSVADNVKTDREFSAKYIQKPINVVAIRVETTGFSMVSHLKKNEALWLASELLNAAMQMEDE